MCRRVSRDIREASARASRRPASPQEPRAYPCGSREERRSGPRFQHARASRGAPAKADPGPIVVFARTTSSRIDCRMPAHSCARPAASRRRQKARMRPRDKRLRAPASRRREIPVDWPHRMSPTDYRALENSCEALRTRRTARRNTGLRLLRRRTGSTPLGGTAAGKRNKLGRQRLIDTPIGTASAARRTRTTAVRYFSDRLLGSGPIKVLAWGRIG